MKKPNQPPEPMSGLAPGHGSAKTFGEKMEFYSEVQNRWLASIVSGSLAIATAFTVPVFGLMFGGPAVLLAAFSGISVLTGVLSLAAKEKRKSLAYVGIALSAAPWILGLAMIMIQDRQS